MATVKFARAQLLRRPNFRDWYLPLVLVVAAAIVVRILLMTGYPSAIYAANDELRFARIPGYPHHATLFGDSWVPAGYPAFAIHPEGDINFLFGPNVAAGESSAFFFLHTGATAFAETAFYDLLTGSDAISGQFNTFAPAVPEPAPTVLLGLGLLTLGWLRSRRGPQR